MDYEKIVNSLSLVLFNTNSAEFYLSNPEDFFTTIGLTDAAEQEAVKQLLQPTIDLKKLQDETAVKCANYENMLNSISALANTEDERKKYTVSPATYLLARGITNDENQKFISNVLTPLKQAQQYVLDETIRQQKEITDVNVSYRKGLSETNAQTVKGFNSTMLMYQVSFYLGVALIVAAIVFAIAGKSSLFAILFGSIGTLDLLTFFIAKPPQSLQQSRSQQATLNAAFYSWFIDLYNWNSYYLQFSSKGEKVDLQTMKEVSEAQVTNTERLMKLISEHITT